SFRRSCETVRSWALADSSSLRASSAGSWALTNLVFEVMESLGKPYLYGNINICEHFATIMNYLTMAGESAYKDACRVDIATCATASRRGPGPVKIHRHGSMLVSQPLSARSCNPSQHM